MLAARAEIADTSAKRRTGLLKHTGLAPGEGLWIVPCEGVHTFAMKFTIDVVFLNRKHKILKIRPNMVRKADRAQPAGALGAGASRGNAGGDRDRSAATSWNSKSLTNDGYGVAGAEAAGAGCARHCVAGWRRGRSH